MRDAPGPIEAVRLEQPDHDTLALTGALTFATAARVFAEATRSLANGAQTRLDLGGVTRADSAGLACVLGLAAFASRAGRRLHVVHWPEGLRALAAVCDVAGLLEPPAATV
ncbi:MAG: STAS domain-containing protein [Rhodanobacteraceae bacterium]|nr:MAG: STAS domain-containing protein [Rhodanobacteraceae bacterium]